MPSLGMSGSYRLTAEEIDRLVKSAIGNYALGDMKSGEDVFIVKYVGRSDTDLNAELKARLDWGYSRFMFSYASSVREAFEKECTNYHDFGGKKLLANAVHPARPIDTNYPCPVLGCTELQ
jgi:hypothetical protein